MLTKDLTLQDFKSFIFERIFETIEFHYDHSIYLKEFKENEFAKETLFIFREFRNNVNSLYCAYLSFGLQISKNDVYQYNLTNVIQMFREFVELKKLEDIRRITVNSSYHSGDEYSFDFNFMIWIEDL